MNVLVTGGAGYVGAHMTLRLVEAGFRPIILDDFSTGSRDFVKDRVVYEGDIADQALVARILREHEVREVIHFAGSSLVQDSMSRPLNYYRDNTVKSRALIEACVDAKVERFVFSSTAAVYGTPERSPVAETAPLAPISAYGASNMMTERILQDAAAAYGFKYVALRYFNVAGADPDGRAGQGGKPTHLVKVAAQIACGVRKEALQIFGEDYPTPDGTCIRDYIHVTDLVDAHTEAMSHMRVGGSSLVLNCGYGRGYSVREVIDAVERVTGAPLPTEPAPRRAGDVPQLIADDAAIRTRLGWTPRYDDLDFIVRTAIDWEIRLAARARLEDL
ncbi:MAG: UDP-glucose 4-epimerase GalE [Pseudomonadota bacterium]